MSDKNCEVCGKELPIGFALYEAKTFHCKECFGSENAKIIHQKKANGELVTIPEYGGSHPLEQRLKPAQGESETFFIVVIGWAICIVLSFTAIKLMPSFQSENFPPFAFFIPAISYLCSGLSALGILVGLSKIINLLSDTKKVLEATKKN